MLPHYLQVSLHAAGYTTELLTITLLFGLSTVLLIVNNIINNYHLFFFSLFGLFRINSIREITGLKSVAPSNQVSIQFAQLNLLQNLYSSNTAKENCYWLQDSQFSFVDLRRPLSHLLWDISKKYREVRAIFLVYSQIS